MNWISIKDKSPEDAANVLVYGIEAESCCNPDCDLEDMEIKTATYAAKDNIFEFDTHCCVRYMYHVKWWMPLPEKPKSSITF